MARQAIAFDGLPAFELKAEARNLLGTDHEEVQDYPGYQVQVNNYDVGRTFSISLSVSL